MQEKGKMQDGNKETRKHIAYAVGTLAWRSQVQCPVVSVAVTVVSLSKELYSHCSSLPSCINGHISPISTVRTSVTYPEGAVQDLERPLRRGLPLKKWKIIIIIAFATVVHSTVT